jgi:L-methionine (R)-S-oxide reductase
MSTAMSNQSFADHLHSLVNNATDRPIAAKAVAQAIAEHRHYRWLGLYQVSSTHIIMIACTGDTPPAFPIFPVTQGLCGSAVALRAIVNVGNVREDPRWLTTFGSTRSELIVPVYHPGGEVVGLIDVESDALNAFSKSDEDFLSSCAPILLRLFT